VWNGIFDHFSRIGIAIWVFLWLIDRVTKERDGVGKVLGGKAIKIREIASGIKGATYQMVRDQLDLLEHQGYITRKRTAYGFVIDVQNSRKWGIWTRNQIVPTDQSENVPPEQSGAKRLVPGNTQIVPTDQNKEDTAVHSSKKTQQKESPASASLDPWKALKSDFPMGCPRFQKIFEHYFATRNGNPLSDAMERTIQAANKRGVKVPPPFFDAKRAVERCEVDELAPVAEIPELEAAPWAT
jgi:hypothetical protein